MVVCYRGGGSFKSWGGGGVKDLSIIEVITCNIAWVVCKAHFSWVWGIPSGKFAKIGTVRLDLVLIKLLNYCLKNL